MEGGSNQPPKGQKGHQEAISPQSFKDILINFHLSMGNKSFSVPFFAGKYIYIYIYKYY